MSRKFASAIRAYWATEVICALDYSVCFGATCLSLNIFRESYPIFFRDAVEDSYW